MRLLDRYLLRELLIPLGYCLGGFLIFWIAFDLFSELGHMQSQKLHGGDIAEYYAVKTPEFLVVVLPIALLLALLYTLTNHARHHEITAMRAAGVSLWRLCRPYLAIGFAASLALFALNELCVPSSTDAAERIWNRRAAGGSNPDSKWHKRQGFVNSADGRRWLIDFNAETHEMRNVYMDWRLTNGSLWVLTAARGVYRNGVWIFQSVTNHTDVPGAVLPMDNNQTNALALPGLSETPEVIQSEINISKGLYFRSARKADISIAEILDYLRLHPRPAQRLDRCWLYTKLYGRLAAPWTCVVVVLVAIPFGAASGRRNVFVGVAGSIFICFTYFVLLQVGLALGAGGYVPAALAAWFPNLAFGLAGLCLTARVR